MSKKILIADDEPNIVAAIEFLLQQRGYDVHTAQDGDEALAVVERVVPDLVLLDVMMPLASGYEVCQRIRRARRVAPHQDHHAVREGPRRGGHAKGSRWAPTSTSPSPSRPATSCPGSRACSSRPPRASPRQS